MDIMVISLKNSIHCLLLLMPTGLTNAPAVFQQAMNAVLREHSTAGYCRVYLDDVLVMSATVEKHAVHLDAVLSVSAKRSTTLSSAGAH